MPSYRIFPVPSGVFAGMTEAQLRAALTYAQAALISLLTDKQPVSVSYAQGDGSKSVTYQQGSEDGLRMLIRQLNFALGQSGRRAIWPTFR